VFGTVLVANRGEIAVRVCRTLARLGIRSVAVYSDADADALHPVRADVAVRIGSAEAAASYLSIEALLEAAGRTGAEAIHPGYGFLAENAAFARACAEAGLVFVGPSPDAIEAMGDKIRAKRTVEAAGVPVVPGVHEHGMSDARLTAAAADIGFPVMVKAAAGGGGKGMRVVRAPADLAGALEAARREARGGFGDDTLLLERYVATPRHIEVQVLADAHGAVLHLGERECSLQRRHQKIVEECPSPLLDPGARARMGEAAVAVAKACGYTGAGTVEFIVAGDVPDGGPPDFYFLEMNARLQVEHAVTEAVYGVDLVELQLRVAAGEPLALAQADLAPRGHAVEARVYAEDPARGFLPTGGRVLRVLEPRGPGVRHDSGLRQGMTVGSSYDPMLSKVIAHGADRSQALDRLRSALGAHALLGVATNVGFLRALLDDDDVRAGRLDTGLVERRLPELVAGAVPDEVFVLAAAARLWELRPRGAAQEVFEIPTAWRVGQHGWATWRMRAGDRTATVRARGVPAAGQARVDDGPVLTVAIAGDGGHVTVDGWARHVVFADDGGVGWLATPDLGVWAVGEESQLAAARTHGEAGAAGPLVAPMPGTVTVVNVAEGDTVTAGQALLVVEAMKMEHPITATVGGVVTAVHVRAGQQVSMEEPLAEVAPADDPRADDQKMET
jgi:acetyl-CoA/propionyl-CoA carboxylase biotin carboxyl carrier protein